MTTDKKELRVLIRQRKRQLTESRRQELSFAINSLLLQHPHVAGAEVVMLYSPLPDEVDTRLLIEKLHTTGKTIVLPAVTGDGIMETRIYEGAESLSIGAYGISEPTGSAYTDYAKIDVAIVPGMAFDNKKHRLGRGKGYYDRFLADKPHIYKIGVCFDFQLVDEVPSGKYDICMDEIVSNAQP